jgi:Type VI secretion system/phage-baseplate injector OB domain
MDLKGIYGGVVEDNKDPEKLGRLKVRVPHVFGAVGSYYGVIATNDLPWALPLGLPNGLSQQSGGADWLPEIGDQVMVQFLDGEPEKPCWQWFMQTIKAAQNFQLHTYQTAAAGSVGPPVRGAWVRYGHTVEWNTAGLILTTKNGYRLLLTDSDTVGNDGRVTLETQAGQFFVLDDITGDTTLNVNNNFNVNVTSQMITLAASFSLITLTDEIEMISASSVDITAATDFSLVVGQDLTAEIIGLANFTTTADFSVDSAAQIALTAGADLALTAGGALSIAAAGISFASVGGAPISMGSPTSPTTLQFLQLSLGLGAHSPYVLGDQLIAYLTALTQILLSHTHPGVTSGFGVTGPMTPPPPLPPPTILSATILGQ